MESAPEQLLEAIRIVDWESATHGEPTEVWSKLRALALDNSESNPDAAAALDLLAAVAGMMLDGTRWDAPYSPFVQSAQGRSHIPDDFTAADLAFFKLLLPTLKPSPFSGRLADVLHLRASNSSERISNARTAVRTWLASGISSNLGRGEEENWQRASEIAARYKMTDERDRLLEMAMDRFADAGGWVALRLARAVRQSRHLPDDPADVSKRLEVLADQMGEPHFRRQLLEEAIDWTSYKNQARQADLQSKIGDSWWDEAMLRRQDSHIVARDFFGNAYSNYRAVSRDQRSEVVQSRLAQLPSLIREEGDLTLGEMQDIGGIEVDVSYFERLAKRALSHEDTLDAFAAWFTYAPMNRFDSERAQAEERLQQSGLLNLINKATLASDGRKIYSSENDNRDRMGVDDELWVEMLRGLESEADLLAQSYIWPTLREFSTRQRFTIGDFETMTRASPFVPVPMQHLYARALHHGYYGRLAEAIYLLGPVTEACVRAVLHRAGIETRNIRLDDTEIEPGLSALMDLDGAEEALTKDLAWNIRALYCGPLGPNLRNRVAHGLLTSREASSSETVYAWWLAFRLVFIPFFNTVREAQEAASHDEDEAEQQESRDN